MSNKFDKMLTSDLLEKYLIGQASELEIKHLEDLFRKDPEVKATYIKMQNDLELVSHVNAIDAPEFIITEDSVLEIIFFPFKLICMTKASTFFVSRILLPPPKINFSG